MNKEEHDEKAIAALKIGVPIFLTAIELHWLQQKMLEQAEPYQNLTANQMSNQEKINFLYAISIGIKCAKEIE
jgi:hypothetical protein